MAPLTTTISPLGGRQNVSNQSQDYMGPVLGGIGGGLALSGLLFLLVYGVLHARRWRKHGTLMHLNHNLARLEPEPSRVDGRLERTEATQSSNRSLQNPPPVKLAASHHSPYAVPGSISNNPYGRDSSRQLQSGGFPILRDDPKRRERSDVNQSRHQDAPVGNLDDCKVSRKMLGGEFKRTASGKINHFAISRRQESHSEDTTSDDTNLSSREAHAERVASNNSTTFEDVDLR
jgi:hypothetical protein